MKLYTRAAAWQESEKGNPELTVAMIRVMPYQPTTLRGMLIGIAGCGLFLATLRMAGMGWMNSWLAAGPALGAYSQMRAGGRGILGGLVGGVVAYVGFGLVVYAHAYLCPQPNTVDYLGPGWSFLILAFYGALVGMVVGLFVWGLMSIQQVWNVLERNA